MVKAVKVAECIVMVGKKQFDMTLGGDQEFDSASSLTATITHVKLEPLDESTICEDDSGLPEDPEDIADIITPKCDTATDKVVNTPTAEDTLALVPATVMKPNTQAAPPRGPDVVVNADHVNFLLTLPCLLTNHSSILDDVYSSIMDTFFLHICIRHAESLGDLNACQVAVNKAIQLWTDAVSQLTGSLGLFPRVSSYNQSVDNLWLCSQAFQHEINLAEKQYLDKRKEKAENAAETKATWKERVWEQVSQAIHQYMQVAGQAILISLGPNGAQAPWLAQITTQACDFQSWIMSAVADYSDIPMELCCTAILQQLDMFLSTTCTLPKVPPTPTSSKSGPKPSNGSWLSGGGIQSSGAGQAIAHSAPGIRQPTGTGLLTAQASTSQTQITPALGQGSSYSHSRGQPVSGGSLLVPIEAMSFGVPLFQPYNLYSSLPQTSTQSSQEVPVSRPVCLMTPVPALHSQDQGSTLAPIF